MAPRMGPVAAFLLGFGVGFALTVLAVGVLGLPLFFVASLLGAGGAFLLFLFAAGAFVGFLFGAVSIVLFYLWSALTRMQQVLVVVLLLVAGLLLVQPELDAIALIGLALTASGVGRGGMARR